MKLGSTSFPVGLPVIPEGNPESNEEDADNDDSGDTTSERGPVKLEPCCPRRLVDVPELVSVRLSILVDGRLL